MEKTSISAGEIIFDILSNDEKVMGKVTKIFPIVTDNANLPYVAYRCEDGSEQPQKGGMGADTLVMNIACFSEEYLEGLRIAEAVRAALDGKQHAIEYTDEDTGESKSLTMRSCYYTGRREQWIEDGNAFVQELLFNIKI